MVSVTIVCLKNCVVRTHTNTINQIEVYVISLMDSESSQSRRERIQESLKGIDYHFFSAVNGKKLHKDAPLRNVIAKDANLNDGQIGCIISHVELWKKLMADQVKCAIILEDDAIVNMDVFTTVKDYANNVSFDMIFLGHCFESQGNWVRDNLYKSVYPRCTHGYMVTKTGLMKLMNWINNSKISQPIDEELAMEIQSGRLESYSVFPSLITTDETFKSTINDEVSLESRN